MSNQPHFSLIIPARNEENRLPRTLAQVEAFLKEQPFSSEIIVVENGSSDRTAEIARAFAASAALPLTVLQEPLPGKGRAVRTGMLAARGDLRFMADADLSMPIEEIPRFLQAQSAGCEVVIASREAPGAVRYDEPEVRHLGGRLVNLVIRLLALPGLQDTQCGFKLFTAEAAEDLFRIQRLPGWSFDIEILYVARLRGYRVHELPIPWYYRAESKVRPVQDALRMVWDILAIRWNAARGAYGR